MCLSKMLMCYRLNTLYLDKKEITGLFEKIIFKVIIGGNIPNNVKIFNSRFVDKIKHAGTDRAHEKS